MKKNSSPSSNATKKYSSLNLNTVYKPNGSNRPGQNGRMLLGTVKKGVVKKAPPPTAPKPLNLPSVKKENAGYDPKIALVPAGGSTWNEGPAANPSTPEAPAPIPINGPVSTTVAPAASPPGPDTSPMSSSPPSSKSVAWGGRGMSKPAPNTTPAPPPQMMPIRPTEDLNRWSRASTAGAGAGNRFGGGGGNAFGAANLQQRMRGKPAVESWPTLAPKEEEAAGSTDTPAANGNPAPTESHELLESKEGDDAWADIDEEMNFDEPMNLFGDKPADNTKRVEEKALTPEEIRALRIAQMEADERRQEVEMQAQQIEDLRREEVEAAAHVAEQQAEKRQKQAAEAAARRKEELERKEQEEEAANNAQPVQEHLKEKAQEARERRNREEEIANQDRKARADAKLQELEAKKAERVREREAAEDAIRAERRKEDDDRQKQRQEEEQRKWGTSKNVWSAPERQGPSDENEFSEDNPPSSIQKRETSRRTLWQAPTDAEKLKRDPQQRESPRGGREPRSIEQREKEFYNKKFEKITDQGDWRERKKDSQAKEQADLKLKRDQRKKADPKPQKESKAKGEESWRKKPDEKKKEETHPKPSGRTDTRKKEGSSQISIPAPKPKGDGDENSEPKSPSPDADGDGDVETSNSLKVPNDSWAYMKTRKWCEQHGVFKWCESKKIPCSKNSDSKELLLEKVAMWQKALANGEVEPSQKPKRARGSRQRKEKEGSGKSEDPKDEDGDNEDIKKRGGRARGGAGRGRNRRDEAGEADSKGKRRNSADDAKAEPKAPKPPPAGLSLDDQVGLQEIAGGLRVASEGGMVVVDSNETCEDDSGFTTEVNKKGKKDAQKEARAQQEKEDRARRRREEKEHQKARQESERQKKVAAAAAEKANAAAKAAAQSAAPAQNLPQPIGESAPRAHSIQDLAVAGGANTAGAAPAKPAWGGQGQNKTAVKGKGAPNFHDIMLEERYQAKAPPTFPVQPNSPQNFEVPAPHPPHGANTGAVGAERKIPSDVQAADPWANPAPAPAPGVSVGSSAFPLGSGAFTQSTFGSFDRPFDSHGTTLTPSQGVAQFTALPSFGASNHYNNAFSAAPTGLGGWGSANDSLSQQQLPTEAPSNHPSGWSPTPNQKPVGPNKSEGANSASNAKSSNGGDKHKRNSRGGKGRGSSKGGGKGKGGKGQDAKDGDAGKSDHSRNNNRGGRQNRRGGKADGGKGGNSNKTGDASASASTSTVDAVVPNKSRRGGGRNAKGGGSRQKAGTDSNAKSHESHQ